MEKYGLFYLLVKIDKIFTAAFSEIVSENLFHKIVATNDGSRVFLITVFLKMKMIIPFLY